LNRGLRGTPASRVFGVGLAAAALAIVALAGLALAELDREGRLHRDVIARLESIDTGDVVRANLVELGHAARIAALTDTPESREHVEHVAADIEGALASMSSHTVSGAPAEIQAWSEFLQSARIAMLHARSVAPTRHAHGRTAADVTAREAERVASDSAKSLERLLDGESSLINRRSLAQIRVGETLRLYVAIALLGSTLLLATVYGLYRAALHRERAALARIERMAHFDTLTGLPNRALLHDRLEQELARAHRSERPFAVVVFDLDGFKAVNDQWGHEAGDQALAIVAERCRAVKRASDTIGRLGGDEFLAVLPETTLDGALNAAEKIRESLAEPYTIGARIARMSASIGVAAFPTHGHDVDELQRAADAAMYEAKRAGKDRVQVAARTPARESAAA